jgi:uncharacterized DUF497 family protein
MPNPPPGYEWNERKAAWNVANHGISFVEAEKSDHEGQEDRTTLLGKIGRQVCVFVFTRRAGKIRVISLRRATAKERRFYISAKGY